MTMRRLLEHTELVCNCIEYDLILIIVVEYANAEIFHMRAFALPMVDKIDLDQGLIFTRRGHTCRNGFTGIYQMRDNKMIQDTYAIQDVHRWEGQ